MKPIKLVVMILFAISTTMSTDAMNLTNNDTGSQIRDEDLLLLIPNSKDQQNESNLRLLNGLIVGDIKITEEALLNGANGNLKMMHDVTPLHFAAGEGYLDIVKCLIKNGADVNEKDAQGATPLDYAVREKQFNIVKYLITTCNPANHKNASPLSIASSFGWLDIAEHLIKSGANTNDQDCRGTTPLYQAASQGHLEVVKLLVNRGANISTKNCTVIPIGSAAYNGHLEVVKYLHNCGADINAKNVNDSSPLCSALMTNNLEVVQFLLSQGAILDAKDFGYALSKELILALIEQTHFIKANPKQAESQKRLLAALCLFQRQNLTKDVCKKILSYLPEDLLNEKHAQMIYNYNPAVKTDLKILVPYCSLVFFNRIYLNTSDSAKQIFLEKIVPLIVDYRLNEARTLLKDKFSYDPQIASIININNIEQHRRAITKHVTNGIIGIE